MVLTPNRFTVALLCSLLIGLFLIFIWAARRPPGAVGRTRFNLKMVFVFVALAAAGIAVGNALAPLIRRNSEIHNEMSRQIIQAEADRRASVKSWHQGGPLPIE